MSVRGAKEQITEVVLGWEGVHANRSQKKQIKFSIPAKSMNGKRKENPTGRGDS